MQENLRLLSIFHYVLGGLHMVFGSFGLIHFGMGLWLLNDPRAFGMANEPAAMTNFMGVAFLLAGGGVVLTGWILGFLTILSGRFIARRRRRLFSVVMGCINCLLVPFGTILGVFTIVLLTRDDVKAIYGESAPA
jgi:hypothetical protein